MNQTLTRYFRWCLISCLLIGGWAGAAVAEDPLQVTQVVVSGNRLVGNDRILPHLKIEAGRSYSRVELEALCREAIKDLYATGLFADIKVDWDSQDEKTLVVTFLLTENPVVGKLIVTGIEEMDSDKVMKAILVKEGETLESFALKVSESNIKALYIEEGYFKVTVESRVEPDPVTGAVTVTIAITEDRKIKVGDISIKYTEPQGFWAGLVDRWQRTWNLETTTGKAYNAETLDKDVAAILRDLRNEGYWGAKVVPDLTFNTAHTKVFIVITITQGAQYTLKEIQLSGNTVIPTEELMQSVTFEPGMIFKEKFIYETIYQLRAKYEARGYANVLIEPQYSPGTETSFVLKLNITEGEIFFIGQIKVLGLIRTREKLVLRELKFRTGDRYDGEKVRLSERNLRNLGFFDNISLEFKPGSQPNTRDVYVTMTEAKTGMLSVGMAYSKLDHLMGLFEVKKRNFSATDPWSFTGRGQDLNLRTEYGSRRKNFYVSWADPWINDNLDDTRHASPLVPIYLGLTGFDLTREWTGYDEGHLGGSLRLGRPIYDDYTNAGMTYKWERIDIDNLDVNAAPSSITEDGERHDRSSSIGLDLTRNTIDNNWDPHTGYRISLSNQMTGGFLGGTIDFNRPALDASWMIPVTKNTTLALHYYYSLIDNPFSAQEVPSYELFYLGGGSSVRGYPERSLAVYPGDNGGHTASYFNVEWRYPIAKGLLSGLVFVDGGNVFPQPGRLVLADFKYGIGLGFRLTLMGMPMRLDYGYRLEESEPGADDAHQGEIHFSFGQMF